MARTRASARPLTEHDEIRRWAEERNAKPAHVTRTGGTDDVGMIRLDFPGYSGSESLEEISWDEWFEKFDERNLALLVQDETARGQKSNFNKLVSRDTAADNNGGRNSGGRNKRTKSQRGEQGRAEKFSSDADMDEELDLEGDIEVEQRPAARRRQNASTRGRARQQPSTARGREATARKSTSARGRGSRNSARSSARGQKSRSRARSSASTKKPSGRARGAQRSSSRSAGRRRAA